MRPVGRRFAAVALVLVLAVAAVYGQTWRHGFINYDDDVYITGNSAVTGGFSARSVRAAFGVMAANWHPLTWFSHTLDWSLFGPWAGGHHLVSVAIHAASAALLFGVLASATGAFWRSAAVAALFALHPLRVESVAWASERKDVLSALLWVATLWAYVRSVRRPGPRRFVAVVALLALGLAAKPMLVTLPFVLLLLDWWPLGRGGAGPGTRPWRALVLEKVPLFALALAASAVTYWAQTRATVPMVRADLATRLANAVVSYARYLLSFAWPADLAFLYPYPRGGVPAGELLPAAAVTAAITAAAILFRRRRPWLLSGWLWYCGTLVPVSGIVQLGAQARSDRYTYLTMIGIALAVVWTAAAAVARRRSLRSALAAACCAVCVVFAGISSAYVRHWRDSLTMMSYTVRATAGNYIALDNLGLALLDQGRTSEAVARFREALAAAPEHCNAQYNLGIALMRLQRHTEAYQPLRSALGCYVHGGHRKDYVADTHLNLGAVNLRLGRPADAAEHYRAAFAIHPSQAATNGLREAQLRLRAAPPPSR